MRQFFEAKRQYRDAIVFFRMGDFYEMFYEDALTAARALELTLTSRSKDSTGGAIPMCGIPYHAADGYIARLVKKGFRVAVCEQVEDPKKAKGLVRREVVRVVSPGTLTDAGYLEAREPAFLMGIAPVHPGPGYGVALLDLSTGEFTTTEFNGGDARQALADELSVLRPREIVAPAGFADPAALVEELRLTTRVTTADDWTFEFESARRTLLAQLQTHSLQGFGLEDHLAATCAAGALVQYLRDTQKADLAHVREIAYRTGADCMIIDPTTLRNLEVVEAADGGRAGSLLNEIDRTVTPMGGRLLRAWLLRPLVALERIQDRLDAVEEFAFRATERAKVRETLKTVHDSERLVARAALGTAGPRDLVSLRQSIAAVPRVRMLLGELQAPLVTSLLAELDDLAELRDELDRTLLDEPPVVARDGGVVRDGVDPELDDLRGISRSGKQRIAEMEEAERARTGITNLKIRYNRVFGYYIEISKSNLGSVPVDYHRKQTIAGGERYITPALKAYEEKVLGADERITEREVEIFEALRRTVAAEAPRIQDTARGIASLDVLAALAETAAVCNYTKPQMHDGDALVATDARHAVVERHAADAFVPNDVTLDGAGHQLVILTGPNMGGKSTYLRQTALLCLMAQAGSFVPARDGEAADRRPHVRPRRRLRQHRARPVDLHGGDAGDGEHPALGHVEQPRHPRRDRARHGDLRRPEPRLGRRRTPGVELEGAPEDDFRDALPRAHGPGGRAAERGELPRRRARVERRHRVPAQGRARALGPQLRHPGGAPRRHPARRRQPGPRDPERAGTRRTVARRPSIAEWRRIRAEAARPLPGAARRGRSRAPAPARAGRRSRDADAGPDAAGGAEA